MEEPRIMLTSVRNFAVAFAAVYAEDLMIGGEHAKQTWQFGMVGIPGIFGVYNAWPVLSVLSILLVLSGPYPYKI